MLHIICYRETKMILPVQFHLLIGIQRISRQLSKLLTGLFNVSEHKPFSAWAKSTVLRLTGTDFCPRMAVAGHRLRDTL